MIRIHPWLRVCANKHIPQALDKLVCFGCRLAELGANLPLKIIHGVFMTEQSLSAIDAKILAALQQDGRTTNQTLADSIGMSASPCWRRVRQLEEHKVIQGYRAVLDRRKIGLGVLVFVRVTIDRHSEVEARKFEQEVMALEDVVACYSIGGDADFLLQVVSRDLDTFADFAMSVIRRLTGIKEMQSMFVLKEIKPFMEYPVKGPKG